MTKENLKLTGIAASLLLVNGVNAEAQKDKKPNIVFVFADQLRHDRVGYAGDFRAHTPNLDRLAAQSMNFRNAVAVSPVSAPMRASLFTGKYSSSTGMVINELRINPDHRTIAHVLGENHYTTAYIGKWHLWSNVAGQHDSIAYAYTPPGPYRLGFDQEWKAYNFHHRNYKSYYFENKAEKIFYGDSVYEPEAQFNMAIDYVESAKNRNEPFALFLSIGVPHDPWTRDNVPEKWYNFYKDTVFGYPETWSDTPDRYMDRFKEPARWLNYYKKNLPEFQRVYYAMTASFDEGMGRLLDKLKELGLDENTIVVVTSDHGEMFGEHGRIQKMIFYDPAARVPFLIRWPGHVPSGAVSDACLNTPDIMPTLLGMGHTYLWEDGSEWRAVRGKQYTYATYRVDGSELLFDNINDPVQAHNLASDPGYQKVKDQMKSFMKTKMADLKDDFQSCTWYRDHWTDGNRNITSAAKGPFKTITVSKE